MHGGIRLRNIYIQTVNRNDRVTKSCLKPAAITIELDKIQKTDSSVNLRYDGL